MTQSHWKVLIFKKILLDELTKDKTIKNSTLRKRKDDEIA